ncbi:hypothetical protein LAZ67_8003344 [Cordylochernes scorpioides]|uniref:Uncharacterized protein n=1 Tax=Cordylochernes scorpioides TaxID=51811 RepID=A0ABY6KWI9_9ARAC|nr:hypothetical protein LAZ67_8003344 [Cordylochernes scorpioides]
MNKRYTTHQHIFQPKFGLIRAKFPVKYPIIIRYLGKKEENIGSAPLGFIIEGFYCSHLKFPLHRRKPPDIRPGALILVRHQQADKHKLQTGARKVTEVKKVEDAVKYVIYESEQALNEIHLNWNHSIDSIMRLLTDKIIDTMGKAGMQRRSKTLNPNSKPWFDRKCYLTKKNTKSHLKIYMK